MVQALDNERLPARVKGRDIFFFDGDCVLCHNMVRFLLDADQNKHFLVCAQQSDTGRLLLERHGINFDDLSTVYIIKNCACPNEEVIVRSTAAVYALSKAPKYAFAARILSLIPRVVLDTGYKLVASNRYKLFGKKEQTCMIPTKDEQERILL